MVQQCDDRLCSLTIECVLLLQNVFSYYRMCSLTTHTQAEEEWARVVQQCDDRLAYMSEQLNRAKFEVFVCVAVL